MIPVFVLAPMPGATNSVPWTDICHRKEAMVFVHHEPHRSTSRWGSAPRKRPFAVYYRRAKGITFGDAISHHVTLAAAEAAAHKFARSKVVS